ncbi:DUF2318 domain-containing protein [Bifidobacterium sp.]|jgi:uncharacterized membrane protein|uniref:DUF2318 domain-containing protein n=1 Tax=Bifidobacterium sp. TaxID=41200 RepID=UPI0025BE00FE|nr:DUF2318 domain-containing protein [Bifidobacterium sp.]MCI1634949.1 DUF2318 domain-containing protein [Bifidobacterium sp.]
MLEQFVTVMPGTLGAALIVMSVSVMLGAGEGKSKPRSSRWRLYGLGIGCLAAVIFAALRATAVINQRTVVNYPTLICCVLADMALAVVLFGARKTVSERAEHPRRLDLSNAIAAVAIALIVFRALPDVILELTIFVEPGDPVFTSAMLLRALGFIMGLAASIIVACIVRSLRACVHVRFFDAAALLLLALIFIQHVTALLTVMQTTGDVFLRGTSFRLLAWLINHATPLIIAQIVVFLLPAIASIVAGFRMPVAGENTAIVRQHTALRRRAKAAGVWTILAVIGVTVALTYGVAQTNQVPVLSPPESYALSSNKSVATIKFSQLADGHLHRFEYKAKDGTVMRFIIIKKNGGAYGVGLDACDNCGDAGYYEKDGKIICKRCDVAINLATIGFAGGCNPIPFPYQAGNGSITIQTSDLDALSSHFKS